MIHRGVDVSQIWLDTNEQKCPYFPPEVEKCMFMCERSLQSNYKSNFTGKVFARVYQYQLLFAFNLLDTQEFLPQNCHYMESFI